MRLALSHPLFLTLLTLRGLALLELQVEVIVVNSTGAIEHPHQQDNGYKGYHGNGIDMQPNIPFRCKSYRIRKSAHHLTKREKEMLTGAMEGVIESGMYGRVVNQHGLPMWQV